MFVIGAAKVSHFEILCRVQGFEPTVGLFRCFYVNSKNKGWMSFSKRQGNDDVCYTKPLDSLKSWNDRFFWVDVFACLASFPWNTSKSASKDLFPKSSQYNAEHYAYPSLALFGLLSNKYPEPFLCLIGISRNYTLDEDAYPQFLRDNDEEMGFALHYLNCRSYKRSGLVAPASAPARRGKCGQAFDEGGSAGMVVNAVAGSASGGHGVGIPQVSETAEIVAEDAAPVQPRQREDGDQTDFMDRGAHFLPFYNRTITDSSRFIVSSDSSTHCSVICELEDDLLKGFFCAIDDYRYLHAGIPVYVPQWSVANGSFLDDGRTCREMVDEFAPPKFFALIRGMKHNELFTEFNVGAARQISLSAEVRMRAEFNIREKRRLGAAVEEKISLLKARDEEVANLKAQLLVKEAEAAEAIRIRAEVQTLAYRNTVLEREKSELNVKVADLTATVRVREQEVADLDVVVTSVKVYNDNLFDQVHTLEVSSAGLQEKVTAYENFIGQLEKFQDDRMREMNEKFDKLDTDLVELALHLEERFYPHLLTTISGRRWLLTHGLELAIAKCLNSTEYLSSLGAAIGKAVEKGMQEGLSAGITHELKSNKDASIDTIMNLLRLEDGLAERLSLTESQPHMSPVPGFRGLKKTLPTIGQHSVTFFFPYLNPFSATALTGTEVISTHIDTASVRSTTLASVSTIVPISIEDYEVAGTDGQEAVNESVLNDATGGSVNLFPNVDDVELNVS
ncbi:hypothetical protein Tco_0660565 [Tanacetum coccineum]